MVALFFMMEIHVINELMLNLRYFLHRYVAYLSVADFLNILRTMLLFVRIFFSAESEPCPAHF